MGWDRTWWKINKVCGRSCAPNSSGVFSHQVLLERLGLELERFALTSNSGRTTDPVDSFRLSVYKESMFNLGINLVSSDCRHRARLWEDVTQAVRTKGPRLNMLLGVDTLIVSITITR